ncbi:MAG: hypothetical protein ABI461_12765, partial [Polyangiaceae bacterium]
MRRRIPAFQALASGAIGVSLCAAAACFPDPPQDDGIPDTGIFISDGGCPQNDGGDAAPASALTLSSATIDFGLVECGGIAPATQTLTLTNTSSSTVTYGAAASGDEFGLASPATGQIAAGATAILKISSTAVSAFAQAGGLIEGALQIVTNAPGQKLFVVDLKKTAAGAQLVMIPNNVDFGLVPVGTTAMLNTGFRNRGNQPLGIVFNDAPQYPFTLQSDDDAGAGITIAPGSTTMLQASYYADSDSQSAISVDFHTTGVLCGGGDPPTSITLQAQRTFGTASVFPGIVTFDVGGTGFVPCAQASTART